MNINVTLLWQMVFFVIFVWFSKKFVWAPIIGALHQRKTEIADGLAAAEKGRRAEQRGLEQAQQVIADAKKQASEIIGNAEKRGVELVDAARDNAKQEGVRITAAAQAEIDTEINKAKATLRGQVGELALAGAQQILKREVDDKAHSELLDDLATKL